MLSNKPHFSQNSLRVAIGESVRAIQGGKSDQDFADEWGVGKGTVLNARNRNHTINLEAFMRLGKEYGPDGIDTALKLIGLRSAPLDSVIIDARKVPHDVAKCLPLLMERLMDGDWSDEDQRAFEDAGVVNCILNLSEKMREMRDKRRLRSVGE